MTRANSPDLNAMYFLLLVLAVMGFTAMQVMQAVESEDKPAVLPAGAKAEIKEPALQFPLVGIVLFAFLGLGTVLLLVYIGLRIGGIRPIRQEPLNEVNWTLGAVVKGLIIVFFVLVAVSFTGPLLGGGAILLLIYVVFRHARRRFSPLEPENYVVRKTGGFAWKFIVVVFFLVGLTLGPRVLLDLPEPEIFVVFTTVVEILAVVWILLMLKVEYGAKLRHAGVNFKAPIRDVGYAFLTYLAILPLFVLTSLLWKKVGEFLGLEYEPQSPITWLIESDSVPTVLLVVISIVIMAPIIEEFFFRGLTYPALRKRFGLIPAVLISSVYFSLIHFDFFVLLPIVVLGVALALLYERRQSLVAPVALHFFVNTVSVGTILLEKYASS